MDRAAYSDARCFWAMKSSVFVANGTLFPGTGMLLIIGGGILLVVGALKVASGSWESRTIEV